MSKQLILDDGKYTIVTNDKMTVFKCLRHGEEWRNLTGDGMVLALVQRIEELEEVADAAYSCLVCYPIANGGEDTVVQNTLEIMKPKEGAHGSN